MVDKSHGWVDSTGWVFQGNSSTGQLAFMIGAGGAGINDFPGVNSLGSVLDNQFHHLAGTWDGSTIRFYVDGALQGTDALSNPANNTRPVNIGFSWGGGTPMRFFRGSVDELEVFNRALTEGEIQAIFNAGSAGKCAPSPGPEPTPTATATHTPTATATPMPPTPTPTLVPGVGWPGLLVLAVGLAAVGSLTVIRRRRAGRAS